MASCSKTVFETATHIKKQVLQEQQVWKGLQKFPLQSFSSFSVEVQSSSRVEVFLLAQQLSCVKLFETTKSIPGLKVRKSTIVVNMIVITFICTKIRFFG